MRTDVQSPGQWLVTYDFDEFGNTLGVTTYKDASTPRVTSYVYDKLNRVTETHHPGTLGTEKFQYDKVGNLRAKMDGNGTITVYEYDALNRARKVLYDYDKPPYDGSWPVPDEFVISTPSVTYTYHRETSLVKTMVDSVGTTSYDYDHRNRMVEYTPPLPSGYNPITYQYDNANNKTQMVTPQGTTTYTYYRNGWLRQVSANSGAVVVDYDYDPAGNRTLMTRNNNTNTQTAFDPRDRVSGIVHNASGWPFANVAYTRDGVGSPLTADWTNGENWNVSYGYDAANRLTRETHLLHGERLWTYDWVGNRLDTGFVYDAQTDELNEGPPGVSRQYSPAGSMTQKATTSYAYNAQELLKQVGASTSMYWDPESRRLRLTAAGSAYYFVYDPTAGVPAVLLERQPTTDVVYIREPDGSLVARIGPGVKYYHFDQLGSTVAMTDGTGAVTDRHDYGAWGEPHPILVSTTDNPYLYVGQLGYYTHWQDPSLADALELGVRFYEPGVGRLISLDPLESGRSNWYVYVDNNPIYLVDPEGLATQSRSKCVAEANGWKARRERQIDEYICKRKSEIRTGCLIICGIAAGCAVEGGPLVMVGVGSACMTLCLDLGYARVEKEVGRLRSEMLKIYEEWVRKCANLPAP